MVVIPTNASPSGSGTMPWVYRKNQAEMSSKANPTTTRPITAPARKATLRPSLSDCLAAYAVRADALVAIFMPNQPHNPENKPATGTPIAVCHAWVPWVDSTNKTATKATKTKATTLYWRVR